MCRELMPGGRANFLGVVNYPKIKDLVTELGPQPMVKILFLLVKDFCSALNVVRNMNEEQQIESASLLLDECDNFRLEDYVMMFQMAKRGELIKIYDRIDLEVINEILDAYWLRRKKAAETFQESEVKKLDQIGPTDRACGNGHPEAIKLNNFASGFQSAMSNIRNTMDQYKNEGQ